MVTSFPSKSELGLHITKDGSGSHLVFVGYAGAGIGALDVSNADAVAGQDPTNPVTFAFGASYAFARTIVSMDGSGHFSYTPTINYGGNNGRSALLGSNGLYYSVGNANNGNAAAFGPNGTTPDVTETTGLEVVTPIDGAASNVAIPAGNSAEVNPLLQFSFGSPPKLDKAGKDDNFRGVTEFGGALYFTKGSGSNGIQTVYTVSSLPTVATAAAADDRHRPRLSDRLRQVDRRQLHALRPLLRERHDDVRERRGLGERHRRREPRRAREVEPGQRHLAARLRADPGPDRPG